MRVHRQTGMLAVAQRIAVATMRLQGYIDSSTPGGNADRTAIVGSHCSLDRHRFSEVRLRAEND